MKKQLPKLIFFAFALCLSFSTFAQISGKVTDADGQGLGGTNIKVKGTNIGAVALPDGKYKLNTTVKLPFTLVYSFVGYKTQEKIVSTAGEINVTMADQSILGEEVVVSASRVEERITKAAVTVEKLGLRQLQQSAAATPFDALQNLKGVDLLTQSLTFKSVNLRGFGANNNNRFVQLTDGMDNRSQDWALVLEVLRVFLILTSKVSKSCQELLRHCMAQMLCKVYN